MAYSAETKLAKTELNSLKQKRQKVNRTKCKKWNQRFQRFYCNFKKYLLELLF